jgi:hypothetical protein
MPDIVQINSGQLPPGSPLPRWQDVQQWLWNIVGQTPQ